METVHFDNWFTKNVRDARSLFDFDFMHKDRPHVPGIRMIECMGKLIGDMCVESSAQRDVDHLAATANAKERFATRGGGLNHFQLYGITRQVYIIDARM